MIPGGNFARRKIEDWLERVSELSEIFVVMAGEYEDRTDSSRPSIEFYWSQKELILFLPIR